MAELLAPVGVYLALFVPYFALSLVSSDAVREVKILPQALFGAVVLLGIALEAIGASRERERLRLPRALTVLAFGCLGFVLASGVAGFLRTDPLFLVPAGAAAALVLAGASRRGEAVKGRAFTVLMVAGALTGLLAFLQRQAGLFLLPFEGIGARYRATALIGNPGDVGAALVLPALLLATALGEGRLSRRLRLLTACGLLSVLCGMAAAEALTPLIAVAAGIAAFTLFDVRRRWKLLLGLGVAAALALAVTGATGRLGKLRDLLTGRGVAEAVTERDIGLYASLEMIRVHPVLGVGPGNFSPSFVPARIRAEERIGRRLTHSSESAHFENAHNEWLTLAAECGLPAALLATAALAVLLVLLARRRADLLFCLLVSVAVLGLASFPSRLAVVAGPTAFVLGLAFRAVSDVEKDSAVPVRRGRVAALMAASALLTLFALARALATLRQAEGEAALRAAAEAPPPERTALLDEARDRLRNALALRPRHATAWLALGSVFRLDHDTEAAEAALETSFRLEERAETDLNLGRAALEAGNRQEALAWFRRAVWILPRLYSALPAEIDNAALKRELKAIETALPRGGKAPPMGAPLRSPRP